MSLLPLHRAKTTFAAIFLLIALAAPGIAAAADAELTRQIQKGQLIVCIASKGDWDTGKPAQTEGIRGLAALAHKYGFPVTYYIKPFAAEASKEDLKTWHRQYGDEVGWFSEGTEFGKAQTELDTLRELTPGQTVRTTGNTKYGPEWIALYQKNGIESVWGRCYEQTFVDGITDRGCPPGFYYARPNCFKAPNIDSGGVISVPWLSNDLNLCFRTAWQPTFTFDPDDTMDIGVTSAAESASFWEAELDEYERQAADNRIVPLVVEHETVEHILTGVAPYDKKRREDSSAVLETLFRILQRRGIKVVTVSQAVDLFKKAYPDRTEPTYAIFGNISNLPCIKDSKYFKLSTERFTKGIGPTFNGYYACTRDGDVRNYYHPNGVSMYEQKQNLTYFDANGLVIYEEGNPRPIRITSYLDLPADAYREKILPEMSYWFDSDQYIPAPVLARSNTDGGFHLKVQVEYKANPIYPGQRLPYGVMLWGDYSTYQVPANAPAGTKILGTDGLIVPMVVTVGSNVLDLDFRGRKVRIK